jgi:hypothetical protein
MSNIYTQAIFFNSNFIGEEFLFHSRNGALLDELIRCYTTTIPNADPINLQSFERNLRRENGKCIQRYEAKTLGAKQLEGLITEWARKKILGEKASGKSVGGGSGAEGTKLQGKGGSRFDASNRM